MKQMIFLLTMMCLVASATSCDVYQSPDPDDFKVDTTNNPILYDEMYDLTSNVGQYWLPKQEKGTSYWIVTDANSNDNGTGYNQSNLRNHILAESIIGLQSLAVNEGNSSTTVWTDSPNSDYEEVLGKLGLVCNGKSSVWDLLEKPEIKANIDGYVLCKMRKQESITVATIASHVYRAVIVDDLYEDSIIQLGYELKYDATDKTLSDGWNEFKNDCNNDALVLMPTQTGNLKSFAIANKLMVVNYAQKMGSTVSVNDDLLDEVLAWLDPLSPVLGWESGGEDGFVGPVSKSGNMMMPSDWLWNVTMTSADYEKNIGGLAHVTNPHYMDTTSNHYASFFMSDGDNVQWMMNGFRGDNYYGNVLNSELSMSFGMPVTNLAMISPLQLERFFAEQVPNNTIVEFCGGGYYYPDNFAVETDNRSGLLDGLATKVADHMRQRRTKVLGVICMDVISPEAKEAYQAYIKKNNQLVGMVAIQYSPYAGGAGEIMWFEISDGIDIPVVTASYSIWNHGTYNMSRQGTPTYIASKLNEEALSEDKTQSLVIVHAWSQFSDIEQSQDPLAENVNGSVSGVEPVSWCVDKLDSNIKVVNVEELIWQIRREYRPEQTKDVMSSFF